MGEAGRRQRDRERERAERNRKTCWHLDKAHVVASFGADRGVAGRGDTNMRPVLLLASLTAQQQVGSPMTKTTSQAPLVDIQPLPRLALFEALASDLEEWILSGRLESGAKLPSEETLAGRFGVSRPVVREALARLRERGLIETVNGSGTFVKPPDAGHLTDAFLRHLRVGSRASIAKAYEARIAIEAATARLAAERATRAGSCCHPRAARGHAQRPARHRALDGRRSRLPHGRRVRRSTIRSSLRSSLLW